jgi:hypothetical protein
MEIFEEREKGFEERYRRQQEMAFKTEKRRDKLAGLWAAQRLGLSGDAADAYARSVVEAGLGGAGKVAAKLLDDLQAGGVAATAEDVRIEMIRLHDVAHDQIAAG